MAKEKSFNELLKEARKAKSVNEALQLFGDFVDCDENIACSHDWQHVLLMEVTDLFEQCRFDESDPIVSRAMRRQLAKIVVVCEAWDKQLR